MLVEYIIPFISILVCLFGCRVFYMFSKEFPGSGVFMAFLGIVLTIWVGIMTWPFLYWMF